MGDPRRRLLTAGAPLLDGNILAKPEHRDDAGRVVQPRQTYREHVVAVYEAWRGLTLRHAGLIARVANRHGLTTDRLLRSSLLCVALHDLGKLSENFLRMMRAADHPRDEAAYFDAVKRNVRHEVIAVPVVRWAATALAKSSGRLSPDLPAGEPGLLETLAVAGHHRYLADCSLLRDELFDQAVEWPDGDTAGPVRAGLDLAAAMFADCGWAFPVRYDGGKTAAWLRSQLSGKTADVSAGFAMLDSKLCPAARGPGAAGRRELFALLKGLLMTADWMASGGDTDAAAGAVASPAADVLPYLRDRVARKSGRSPTKAERTAVTFNGFQTRCRDAPGHVVAIAPTGRGKTEAALLWALRQAERGQARKLLVLLPTMVTANSLQDRLAAFFTDRHKQPVGLAHSTADLIAADRAADKGLSPTETRAVRDGLLGERHFFRPVTAGTVDQLLSTLLHGGRWPMKTLAAADAAVVIDEVHAYDAHTAGLVTLLIETLRPLGTRFFIMSATLPDDLRETLEEALGDPGEVETIRDDSLDDHARNDWSLHNGALTDWVADDGDPSDAFADLMAETNDRGEPPSVLIVVNTVRRCQELARALSGFDPVCLHSKFIFDHRRAKERAILSDPPRLLIATQVVEVSLDLDHDVLLTECAPIDALVQRAGRVNRPRREVRGRVTVFRPEAGSDKVYGEPRGVLDKTWAALAARCGGGTAGLTEATLKSLAEEVYAGRRLRDEPGYAGIRNETIQLQEKLGGVLDHPRPDEDTILKTRLESYVQVDAVPEQFEQLARDAAPADRRRYELKVPLWYFKLFGRGGGEELPVVELESYDERLGAVLKDTPNSPGHPLPTGSQFC